MIHTSGNFGKERQELYESGQVKTEARAYSINPFHWTNDFSLSGTRIADDLIIYFIFCNLT